MLKIINRLKLKNRYLRPLSVKVSTTEANSISNNTFIFFFIVQIKKTLGLESKMDEITGFLVNSSSIRIFSDFSLNTFLREHKAKKGKNTI